jgi:hypothetical protein
MYYIWSLDRRICTVRKIRRRRQFLSSPPAFCKLYAWLHAPHKAALRVIRGTVRMRL